MVRLTADLILRSPQYFNAVRERELDLRGNKIVVVENLGATEVRASPPLCHCGSGQKPRLHCRHGSRSWRCGFLAEARRRRRWRPQDQYGSIDLSDNEISKLEGFPLLRRLNTLLLNNNRVMRISPALGASLPALHTLVLTGNRLQNLADLDGLAALGSLRALSLLDNVVAKKPNYRLYVLHKLPSLRLLDFRKVKHAELAEVKKVFGSKEAEAAAKKASANTFVPGEGLDDLGGAEEEEPAAPKGPTPEQLIAIKAAIATAQTFEEVARLEKVGSSHPALVTGVLPSDLKLPGDEVMREAGDATEVDGQADAEDVPPAQQENGQATLAQQDGEQAPAATGEAAATMDEN
eukprot:SM000187S03862  [mRNA]  locus=s187:64028:65688:+ [translate_table: standard]